MSATDGGRSSYLATEALSDSVEFLGAGIESVEHLVAHRRNRFINRCGETDNYSCQMLPWCIFIYCVCLICVLRNLFVYVVLGYRIRWRNKVVYK